VPPRKLSKQEEVLKGLPTTTSDLGFLPFKDVIEDPMLMKPLWDQLSAPQQVALKAFYGLPLEGRELDIWAIFQDSCTYDPLGYVTDIVRVPYTPKEYSLLVGILGRRSGKSSQITAFATLYEILFGGHMKDVMKGQDVVVPYIAQDLATAKANMVFVALMAQQVPLLAKQISYFSRDRIEFKNGIVMLPEPPAIKTGRGFAMPIVIGDEVGFWYKTAEAANPDVEVQRAVRHAQAQFSRAKQFLISTPYTEEGLLWKYHRAGTAGAKTSLDKRDQFADVLVLQASTAAMENPRISRKRLVELQMEDPDAFIRESLARFVSSINSYFPAELIHKATMQNKAERTRAENEDSGMLPNYVAAMDPAFRHDDFAFSIFHVDKDGTVVQDVLKVWSPNENGGQRLNPGDILAEIGAICHNWNIGVVYSDQYQLESLQQMAQTYNFSIIGKDFTGASKAKIYGSLLHLMRTEKIKLLDKPVIITQLTQLQKKLGAMNTVRISAPNGKHDDVASVIALGASVALMHRPDIKLVKKEPTLFDLGMDCIRRRRLEAEEVWT
jgi:hypothetical protein